MKYLFLITGPNCSGKTTAVKACDFNSPNVVELYADHDKRATGDADSQQALVEELWTSQTPVVVIEGTNRIVTALYKVVCLDRSRKINVTIATMTPDVMRANLQARCARAGKTYRADYWTLQKLTYEGQRRLPNLFRRFPSSITTIHYVRVTGVYETDWAETIGRLRRQVRECL